MLRPDMLLALSLTGTSVDALLRTGFSVHRHPSYTGAWPLPRPNFHRLEDACFLGTPYQKEQWGYPSCSFHVLNRKFASKHSTRTKYYWLQWTNSALVFL